MTYEHMFDRFTVMTEQVFGRVYGSSPKKVHTTGAASNRTERVTPGRYRRSRELRFTGDARRSEADNWVAEEVGREHLMTLVTSARIRALSIISITVIVVLLFLSSAVQATGEITETTDYRVKSGDTLWQIAQTHGPEGSDTRRIIVVIEKLNDIDGGALRAGQVIEIPVLSS